MVKKGEKTLDKIRKKLLKDSFRNYTFNTEINKDLLEHYEESLIEEAREKVFLNKFKKMKINKDDFEMVDSIYVKPDASSKSSSKSSTNSSKSPSKSSTKSSKSEVSRGSSKSSKASTKNSKLSSKGSKGSKSSNMVNTGNKKYTYVDHEDYVSRPFLNNRGIPVRINTLLTMEKLRQKTETPKIPKRSTKPFPGTEQKGRGIVKKTRKPKKPVLKKNIYKAGSSAKVSLGGFVYRGVYAGGKVVNVDTVQADVDIMKIERGQVDIGSVVDFVDSFGDMKKGRISKILGNRLTIKFNKSQKYTFPKASIKIVGSIFI
jgi:hypothetical protein